MHNSHVARDSTRGFSDPFLFARIYLRKDALKYFVPTYLALKALVQGKRSCKSFEPFNAAENHASINRNKVLKHCHS